MNIIACILKIYPDWKGTVQDNEYDGIKPHKLETRTTPTLEELQAVWPEVETTLALTPIRAERDRLLDKADLKYCNAELWSAMSTETKALWTAYKQALRDLPATIDLANPVWPTMPTT